jgi:hypothetical protein
MIFKRKHVVLSIGYEFKIITSLKRSESGKTIAEI